MGFEHVASAFAVQCSTSLSYEDPYTENRPIYWVHQPVKGMKHRIKWCELQEYKWNEYVTIAVNRNLSNCEIAQKKVFRGFNEKLFLRAISQLLKLRFAVMVTYSFHLYSCSSHHFILYDNTVEQMSGKGEQKLDKVFKWLQNDPDQHVGIKEKLYRFGQKFEPIYVWFNTHLTSFQFFSTLSTMLQTCSNWPNILVKWMSSKVEPLNGPLGNSVSLWFSLFKPGELLMPLRNHLPTLGFLQQSL